MADKPAGGCVIPGMRYADAPAAIKFLCEAFGFEEHLVVPANDGTIPHAQLVLGNGMIMLGSLRDDEFSELMATPLQGVTQAPYIVVPEIDAHYEQAKAAGATIIKEIEEQPYGGKLYSARDPEGHLWHFGSYDPWAEPQNA